MFTFQSHPLFFSSEQDLDIEDAQVNHFTPFYYSKLYSTRYTSSKYPLHYANRLLIQAGDVVLHLIETQGRVVDIQAARVWDTLYDEEEQPIGAVLIHDNPKYESHFYPFTKFNSRGEEKWYFRNQFTLNQKEIYQYIDLLSRKQDTGKIWLPERGIIEDSTVAHLLPHPHTEHIPEEFLKSAVGRYAKAGSPASLFAAGFLFRAQGRYPEALHGFQMAAERNYALAWLELGLEYLNGHLLGEHPDKATGCFKQAAYGGLPLASYYLALSYIEGVGIEQSDTLALRHMQRAVEGGVLAANLALGLYYRHGSFNHLRSRSSQYRELRHAMTNHQLAAQLFFKAANNLWKDVSVAIYHLAECYRLGLGVNKDKDYAQDLYRQAAAHGNIKLEEIQSAAYYAGNVNMLTEVAQDDEPLAAYFLGRMYLFGEFVPKDYEIAKRYLKIAANSGSWCAEDANHLLHNMSEYWQGYHQGVG